MRVSIHLPWSILVLLCICARIISLYFNINSAMIISLLSHTKLAVNAFFSFFFLIHPWISLSVPACMSAVLSMLNRRSLLILTAGLFSNHGPKPQHAYIKWCACVNVRVSIAGLFIAACAALWTKSPWSSRMKYGGPNTHERRARVHTSAHTCVCESELSVLLSHTIHHRLLILLDHCRAFRTHTPLWKLNQRLMPPTLPTHNLTHTRSHTHTEPSFLAHTHLQRPWGDSRGLGRPHRSDSISVAWIWWTGAAWARLPLRECVMLREVVLENRILRSRCDMQL